MSRLPQRGQRRCQDSRGAVLGERPASGMVDAPTDGREDQARCQRECDARRVTQNPGGRRGESTPNRAVPASKVGRAPGHSAVPPHQHSDERLAHEEERFPAGLAAVLHLDQLVGGQDVAHGRNRFTLAGGTSALTRLGHLRLGREHGTASYHGLGASRVSPGEGGIDEGPCPAPDALGMLPAVMAMPISTGVVSVPFGHDVNLDALTTVLLLVLSAGIGWFALSDPFLLLPLMSLR